MLKEDHVILIYHVIYNVIILTVLLEMLLACEVGGMGKASVCEIMVQSCIASDSIESWVRAST